MNKSEIESCVHLAVGDLPFKPCDLPKQVDPNSTYAMLLRECSLPSYSESQWRALYSCLEQQGDIKDFFTGYIRIGNGGRVLQLRELVEWLLAQNALGRISEALLEIERIIQTNTGSGYFAAAFLGASVEREIQISDSVSLVPIANLPLSTELDLFKLPESRENRLSFMLPHYYCSTAVLSKYNIEQLIIPASQLDSYDRSQQPNNNASTAEQIAYDVLDSLVLDGPRPCVIIHEWHGLQETLLYAELGMNRSYISQEINPNGASTHWVYKLDPDMSIEKAYLNLSEDVKIKLRIPIDRLNLAILRQHSIECIIELGICFEALLLDDEKTELTYRLKKRGEYLHEGSLEERLEVGKQLGRFYDLRSRVIHTGKGKEPKTIEECIRQDKEIRTWINLASKLIRNAVLNGGIPYWENLVLSSQPDEE